VNYTNLDHVISIAKNDQSNLTEPNSGLSKSEVVPSSGLSKPEVVQLEK
ncbi:7098_t:CDS:1, partial [Gigaspora margarita]